MQDEVRIKPSFEVSRFCTKWKLYLLLVTAIWNATCQLRLAQKFHTCAGWSQFFPGGVVIVDFSRALPNDFFQKGPVGLKFHFTTPNIREKHFSTKLLIGKYQISKSRDCPLPLLSDSHVHTMRLRVADIKVYEILPEIISSTLYSACQI